MRPEDIKAARKRARLSVMDLARLIGVPQSTIVRWETKARAPRGPALALLTILQRAPGVFVSSLRTPDVFLPEGQRTTKGRKKRGSTRPARRPRRGTRLHFELLAAECVGVLRRLDAEHRCGGAVPVELLEGEWSPKGEDDLMDFLDAMEADSQVRLTDRGIEVL